MKYIQRHPNQVVAQWGDAPQYIGVLQHRRLGRSLRYVMGRIPSSQCTRWCGITKRDILDDDTSFLPQVTHAGFRGRCHKVGSDRLNRQAVSRFDQMVDEVLQADLCMKWNKI